MAGSDPSHSDVQIRDVEDGDVELFFEHQMDPEATRMAAFPARERDPFMAHWAKIRTDQTVITQAIVVDGHVAGNVVSWEQSGRRTVGYWIGSRHWGRGIATKALTLFLGRVTLRPLYAYVAVHNVGSIRVLEKCGFRRVQAQDVHSSTADTGKVEEVMLVLDATPVAARPQR
jgi:RimJ/RimL family protein N-acetyltransferase